MAITPQHEKGEATEADLEKAYNKARSIGLFLVEKMARERLRRQPLAVEFKMARPTGAVFLDQLGCPMYFKGELEEFIDKWDDKLDLYNSPMRFTATGPVRREW